MSTRDDTTPPQKGTAQHQTAYNVFLFILATFIFLTNSLVLVTIVRCRRLHVPSNVFVASMALSDALVGCVGLPFKYISSLDKHYSFGTCMALVSVYLYFCDVSVYMLLGLTFDRLFAIRFPFSYHQRIDCKDAIIASGVLWIAGSLLAFIPQLMMEDELVTDYDTTCTFFAVTPKRYLADFRFYLIFIGTLGTLVLVNIYTYCVVRRHKRKIARQNVTPTGAVVTKKDVKATYMLIVMVAVFIFCGLPLNGTNMLYVHTDVEIPGIAWQVMLMLYYFHSLLKPIIYAFGNHKVRSAIRRLVTGKPLNTHNAFETCTPTRSTRPSGRSIYTLDSIKTISSSFKPSHKLSEESSRTEDTSSILGTEDQPQITYNK